MQDIPWNPECMRKVSKTPAGIADVIRLTLAILLSGTLSHLAIRVHPCVRD